MKRVLTLILAVVVFASCEDNTDYIVTISTEYGDMKAILYDETPQHKENFIKLARSGQYDSTIFHRVIESFMIQGGDINAKANKTDEIDYTIPAEFVPKYFHHKGALAAARQGDQINPKRASSGSQFYIVQGVVYDEAMLTTDLMKLNNGISKLLAEPGYEDLRQQYIDLQNQQRFNEIQQLSMQYRDTIVQKYKLDVTKEINPERLEAYTTLGGTPHLDDTYTVFGKVVEGMEVIDKIAAQQTGRADKPIEDIYMTVSVEEVSKATITEKYGYQYSGTD